MKIKSNSLARLSGTDWGHKIRTQRSTYVATGRALAEYAAAAWHPWMSSTSLEKLKSAQRHAGRRICGLLKTTPYNNAILVECDLPPMETRSMQLALKAYEKSLRLHTPNPSHKIASHGPKRRSKKPYWRNNAKQVWNEIFTESEPWRFPPNSAPLKQPVELVTRMVPTTK